MSHVQKNLFHTRLNHRQFCRSQTLFFPNPEPKRVQAFKLHNSPSKLFNLFPFLKWKKPLRTHRQSHDRKGKWHQNLHEFNNLKTNASTLSFFHKTINITKPLQPIHHKPAKKPISKPKSFTHNIYHNLQIRKPSIAIHKKLSPNSLQKQQSTKITVWITQSNHQPKTSRTSPHKQIEITNLSQIRIWN